MSKDKFYFTSGELAKMSGTSYKTIRYYVDKGLLKPEQITEHGYKMFGKKSVEDLQKILLLKYLDFPLEEIKRMMYDGDEMVSFSRQEQLIREKLTHLEEILHAVTEIRQISEVGRWDKMLDIMKISSRKEEIRKNYLKSDNLEKRINIHVYSTAKETWYQWLFEKFELKENMHVLDVGCGNASIWLEMREKIPNGVCITLVDISRAMLDTAKKKLMTYKNDFERRNIQFIYQEMDVINLSIDGIYDRVLANHMLYHIADDKRDCLIKRMGELTKVDGKFFASTVGKNHMKELFDLIQEFAPQAEVPDWMSQGFCLENGEEQIMPHFSKVEVWKHDNNLLVPDVNAIFDYLASLPGNINSIVIKNEQRLKEYLKKKISEDQPYFIQKATGVVIACK